MKTRFKARISRYFRVFSGSGNLDMGHAMSDKFRKMSGIFCSRRSSRLVDVVPIRVRSGAPMTHPPCIYSLIFFIGFNLYTSFPHLKSMHGLPIDTSTSISLVVKSEANPMTLGVINRTPNCS